MHLQILIPLALLLSGQVYVSVRTWQLLPAILPLRIAAVVLMSLALALAFLSVSPLTDRLTIPWATFTYEVGTSWLIVLLYLVLIYLLFDLLCLCRLLPASLLHANGPISVGLALALTLLFFLAWRHYEQKQRVELTITTQKPLDKEAKIVLVSDIHLGYHNTKQDLHRWLQLIEAEHPDLMLIAGDIIDGRAKPVEEQRMSEAFSKLPFPVVACLGNHDYYTGIGAVERFCHQAGILLLRDKAADLNDIGNITVIGRDDRTNTHRKPLSALMQDVDRHRFTIELDHQPYHLEEAEHNGIDFEFAGHTHHGQVWPISWITDAVYEKAFGPLQKGRTHYHVSSGLGIWGAKFRIGTQSEYIVLHIKPSQSLTKNRQ